MDYIFYITLLFEILITYTYFKASLTNATQSDVNKYFDLKTNELIEINPVRYTYCEYCKIKKFDRTSHCRTCNYCVLRRDHHCVWIGNCVGEKNNQYFFNFCVWVVVSFFFLIFKKLAWDLSIFLLFNFILLEI